MNTQKIALSGKVALAIFASLVVFPGPLQAAQIRLIESSAVASAAASRSAILLDSLETTTVEDDEQVLFGFNLPASSGGTVSASATATVLGGSAKASVSASWFVNQPSNFFVDSSALSGRVRITGNQSVELQPATGFGSSNATAQVNLKFETDGESATVRSIQSDLSGTFRQTLQTSASHFLRLVGGPPFATLLFSFDDAPLLGAAAQAPLPPDSFPLNPPPQQEIEDAIDEEEEPPSAHLPGDIAGINLTSFSSPVESNGYGNTETTYFGGSVEMSTPALTRLSNSQAAATNAVAPSYVAGYLFLNNGGSNFTSFVLPEALASGDSQFRINLDGEGFDLSIGDVFDFTAFDAEGVESFLLVGIDESETIPVISESQPFTFGMTFATGAHSGFVAVPLVQVPELRTLALASLGVTFLTCSRVSLRSQL